MRTDLRRACLHCALRLPDACAECPRCRLSTTSPRKSVEALGQVKASVQVSRPVRDALIYIPAALLYVAAAGLAVYVAGLALMDLGAESGGLGVAVSAVTLLSVFSG